MCVLPAAASLVTSRSRTSTSRSTSSAAYSNHESGSGRVDQSAARWCLAGGGVFLGGGDAEKLFHDRGESRPGHPEQACCELGVKNVPRVKTHLAEAGEGLACGGENPFLVSHTPLQVIKAWHSDRIEQKGPGSSAKHLDEVGTLRVPVTAGTLRIDRNRSAGCEQPFDRPGVFGRGVDEHVVGQ